LAVIDDKLELGRRLHRQVGRLLALEDAIDVASRPGTGRKGSRLYASQLAFPHEALVRFVHAFYSIFEFTAALRQSLFDFIRAARSIAAPCGVELYALTNAKFVGQHGTLQRKS
jgi:hypothetical protein